MIRDRRSKRASFLLSLVLLLIGAAVGCISLSYDEPRPAAAASEPSAEPAVEPAADRPPPTSPESTTTHPAATSPDRSATARRDTRRPTPTRARLEQRPADDATNEPPRSWRELSRKAREQAQAGKLEEANELLAQAALQLADRRPTTTQRRTVFGLRARLARDLAAAGKTEAADALADQLFEEARRAPALGDAALVSLARATAERRHAAALKAGRSDDSQLPLLALALETAQSGTASRDRLGLAFEVSGLALRAGELDLARRAIDQCAVDAQIVAPADRLQAASIKVYKARIALAQRELATAEAAANAAVKLFEDVGAGDATRGVAETTLAQIVAEQGELDRGLELARAAFARLSGAEKLVPHARRLITAGLARVERLSGDADAAAAHYREALVPPSDDSTADEDLIRDIRTALADLESGTAAPDER